MTEHIHGDVSRYDPRPLPSITSHNDAAPAPAPSPAPRELLKQRSAAVEAAKVELQRAQGFADKADRMLEAATTTFRESQTVSHDVRTFKIAAFKKGSTDPLPTDLVEARREAIFAAEEYEHAQAVAGQMTNELAAADRAFRNAEQFKSDAANALVTEEVGHVVAEIKDLGRRRQYLRDILRGASLANVSQDQHQKFGLLTEPAMRDPAIAELAYPPSAPGSTKYWNGFRQALLSDPDAQLGQPPAAEDLWS
jgi:hypothetical protein